MSLLLVAAIALDSLTLILMGPSHEANPAVLALGPLPALGIRWTAVVLLVVVSRHATRYERIVRPGVLAATAAGLVGALSNLLVVL